MWAPAISRVDKAESCFRLWEVCAAPVTAILGGQALAGLTKQPARRVMAILVDRNARAGISAEIDVGREHRRGTDRAKARYNLSRDADEVTHVMSDVNLCSDRVHQLIDLVMHALRGCCAPRERQQWARGRCEHGDDNIEA